MQICKSLVIGSRDGRVMVAGIDGNDRFVSTSQTSTGWANWSSGYQKLRKLVFHAASTNVGELYGIDTAGNLVRADNCGIEGWLFVPMGVTGIGDVAVIQNGGGLDHLFLTSARQLWHSARGPQGWGTFTDLGGDAGKIAVKADGAGIIQAFAIGTKGNLSCRARNADGSWGASWTDLGGNITEIVVAANQDGHLEAFGVGSDKALWHIWQTSPQGAWSDWASLGGEIRGIGIAANADGRLEIVGIGSDDAVWHIGQTAANGGWSNWTSMGASAVASLTAGTRPDGAIILAAVPQAAPPLYSWEQGPAGPWSSWAPLSPA